MRSRGANSAMGNKAMADDTRVTGGAPSGGAAEAPPRPAAPAGGRLPGLEALRCVAAFCVLLLHARAVFGGAFIFGRGYLGVDFFLMLSGYLMARVQEPRLAAGLAPGSFMAKRYRRLWPMMAAGGLIGMPLLFVQSPGPGQFAVVAAVNMALLPVWGQTFVFPLNIPAWTIFGQIVCEGSHVAVLRRLRGWLLPAVIVALGAATAFCGAWHGSLDVGAKPETLGAGLVRCLFAYSVGMGLARWWGEEPPIPVPPLLALVVMPAVIAGSWALHVNGWWCDWLFVVLVCPVMLAGGLRLRRFRRQAGWLGQLSVPLFALQMPVLQGMHELGFGYWHGLAGAVAMGIGGVTVPAWWRARKAMLQPM